MLIGKSRDNEGIETGGIETGGIETGVIETGGIEMLKSSRGRNTGVGVTVEVMVGDAADVVRSNDARSNE